MMKLGVVSLGCDKATVDSERLVGELVSRGARVVEDAEEADVLLINTCGFIDAAKQESIDTILQAAELKRSGRVKAVVAVGCLVQRYRDELAREIPEVDLFLGFDAIDRLVPALASKGFLEEQPGPVHPRRFYLGESPHVRYLKISEGCDHGCAFCAIPLMRGRHRSEPVEQIVREAQMLEAQGAREINLVAQDLAHYGRDFGREGPKLPDLLETLLRETKVPWFRLLYVYSSGITPRLLELMASEKRIVPYIDMPIQHASDRMLRRMRRPERRETIREKVQLLRDSVPDIAIRTTVIVGFPGETEEDFRCLVDFVEEMGFEHLGVFTYSPQEGTRAALEPDDVPDEVKRQRQEELIEVQRVIAADRLARFAGREVEVLVDRIAEPDEEGATHVGRVPWQADDVDGITYVERGGWARPGDFVRALIVGNLDGDFRAVAVP
ncbi:Ribosomal protein S12 methylthiotransferase RimO [bacterium HR33]|nr:Ribosomal protein S12 methylthiotransferase RimO [bacterium HR33]